MRRRITVGVAVFALAVSATARAQPVYSFQGLMEPVDSVREVTHGRRQMSEGRALYLPPAGVGLVGAPERSEAGGFRVQRGNDPIWDGALKGFAVGAAPLLAVYAYAWKHEGEAPTVKGGPAALAGGGGSVRRDRSADRRRRRPPPLADARFPSCPDGRRRVPVHRVVIRRCIMLLRTVLVIALAAAPAGAQPVDSFREFAELIEIGRAVVVVTSPDGAVITGRLVDISPAFLTVFADGRRIELDEARVLRVRQGWNDPIEQARAPREVCEAALAHGESDRTVAAYTDGANPFDDRAELMQAWADFLLGPSWLPGD